MSRSKSRSGYLEFGQKKHQSFLIRSISGSKICRGDALSSQVAKEAVISVDRKSISLSENRIVKAAMMQKQITDLEEELQKTKARLDEAESERNRLITELNAGLSSKKAEQVYSELKILKDSLSNSKKEIESRDKEMKLLNSRLDSAKAFEVKLAERDKTLEQLKKDLVATKDESKKQFKELEDQVEKAKQSESKMLESLTFQTQKIMQTKMDLEESKLEVASLYERLENGSNNRGNYNHNQNQNQTSSETRALNEEIAKLKNDLNHAMEAEEKSKKAMDGLASALQEVATNLRSTEHENSRLKEALVAAETTARIAREEAFKLRDILKQALNESNVAKEASAIARSENSELKDLLAEKEAALHFLAKENERLRVNQVAGRENVKEFNSPLSSLYEDHPDGRGTPRQTFSFDLDDVKVFNQEEDVADIVVMSEPQTPEFVPEHRRSSSVYADAGGVGQSEEGEHAGNYTEDGEDKSYYSRKKLFKKIGELIVGKSTSKKEGSDSGSSDTPKEHSKEQFKESETTHHHSSGFRTGWKKVGLHYGSKPES